MDDVLKQMLIEKGLQDDAVDWVIQDITPRLSFLDGNLSSEVFAYPPGMSSLYARAIRSAFQELLGLEVELYYEKSRHENDNGQALD